jgi:predicted transcriptional regulator
MTAARKVLDWKPEDPASVARELRDLPAGRYVLVPEHEVDEDEAAAIQAGIDEAERGDLVEWTDVRQRLDALIASARERRAR